MTDTEKAVKQVDAVLERMWKGYRIKCRCGFEGDGPKELDPRRKDMGRKEMICPKCATEEFRIEML